MSRNRLMLLVAVMASVIVALAGFFVGVQPQLASARASEEQRQAATQTNASSQQRITQLAKENRTLSQQKAELAVLQGSIPTSLEQSSFYRELSDLAAADSVTIASLTTSDAQAYSPPQSADTSGGSTGSTSGSATAAPTASATAAAPQAPAAATNSAITSANFSAVPVSVGVNGSFAQATAYMKAVQNGKRLFLVNSIVSSAASASGSDTDAATGPTTWTLSGFIYVLQDASSTQAEQAASSSPSDG